LLDRHLHLRRRL